MLGFLLPKLAWLSMLALLPVVIHLLNRVRLRRVDFSSLRFLSDVKRERFNWLRLKELLLLIARTALLLFLFLGLSRPFLKHGLFGIRREVSAVLIIDDSYSMQYGGNADQARRAAKAYLAQLTGSSEAAVLTASTCSLAPLLTGSLLTRDIASLARSLDTIEMSYLAVDLAPAVEQARALLEKAILPTREIVIFTDSSAAPWSRSLQSRASPTPCLFAIAAARKRATAQWSRSRRASVCPNRANRSTCRPRCATSELPTRPG